MKRSQRLLPVIKLAEQAELDALTALGQVNTTWHQDQRQLEDLHHYKGEYLQRFRQGEVSMLGTQKMMELRAFLLQLDQAIKAQQQQVEQSLEAVEYQKTIWMEKRSKAQAIRLLAERYQGEELSYELRRELLENDEYNTTKWLRNRSKP